MIITCNSRRGKFSTTDNSFLSAPTLTQAPHNLDNHDDNDDDDDGDDQDVDYHDGDDQDGVGDTLYIR